MQIQNHKVQTRRKNTDVKTLTWLSNASQREVMQNASEPNQDKTCKWEKKSGTKKIDLAAVDHKWYGKQHISQSEL